MNCLKLKKINIEIEKNYSHKLKNSQSYYLCIAYKIIPIKNLSELMNFGFQKYML